MVIDVVSYIFPRGENDAGTVTKAATIIFPLLLATITELPLIFSLVIR